MIRLLFLLGLVVVLLIGWSWALAADAAGADSACPHFSAGVIGGQIESALLSEASGIVASRKNANVLWAHNDPGDSTRVFALDMQGRHLGIYNLTGASATDWEDIALGPGPIPTQDYLYISDTGDNARQRASIAVYRVPEPAVGADQTPVSVGLTDWDRLPMRYPGAVYDAETLLLDPISHDLFVVTRDRAGEGFARVFRNPAPHTADVMVTLEQVATISLAMEIKGGDISPSGDAVLLRPHLFSTPANGYYWRRTPAMLLWEAFANAPCLTPLANEPQGEALAFTADGTSYIITSEGNRPPLYYYSMVVQSPVPLYLPFIQRQ